MAAWRASQDKRTLPAGRIVSVHRNSPRSSRSIVALLALFYTSSRNDPNVSGGGRAVHGGATGTVLRRLGVTKLLRARQIGGWTGWRGQVPWSIGLLSFKNLDGR